MVVALQGGINISVLGAKKSARKQVARYLVHTYTPASVGVVGRHTRYARAVWPRRSQFVVGCCHVDASL